MDKSTPEQLKEKLMRALKAKAVLAERSKRLEEQLADFRKREDMMHHFASELLDRQRELNLMLHRANSVLHQLQETNLALSAEFTELVKELPPAKDPEVEDHVARVNELFRKTHELAGKIQEEIFLKTSEESITPPPTVEKQPDFSPDPSECNAPQYSACSGTEAHQNTSTCEGNLTPQGATDSGVSCVEEPAETEQQVLSDSAEAELAEVKRLDQLFRSIEGADSDSEGTGTETQEESVSKKPGFFARIFGIAD